MKKVNLTIIISALVCVLSVALSSCSKEEEFSLVGKTYSYTSESKSLFSDVMNKYTYSIRFTSATTFEYTYFFNGKISKINNGTYILEYPYIHFKDFGTYPSDEEGELIDDKTIRVGKEQYKLE